MIENIKRFVNEHHTLMVVIIDVLVICFLYWFFCCKDKPLENKVKGGEVCLLIINDREYIGMLINEPFFYVLSPLGEDLIKEGDIIERFAS